MQFVSLAADLQGEPLAEAGAITCGDRLGIEQAGESSADLVLVQRGDQFGAVGRGAAADVVPHVEQANAIGDLPAASDCFLDGDERAVQLFAVVPHAAGQFRHHLLCERTVVVGDDDGGSPHLRHIRIREPEQDAVREDARTLKLLISQFVEWPQVRLGRALALDADRQRREAGGHRRADLATHGADDKTCGFEAAFPLIEVRVGAIGGQGVATADHRRRQVGVGIECADYGKLRADGRAELLEPVTVGIRPRLADGRSMRCDEDAVQAVRIPYRLQQAIDKFGERIGRHRSGR